MDVPASFVQMLPHTKKAQESAPLKQSESLFCVCYVLFAEKKALRLGVFVFFFFFKALKLFLIL
jgi:hypothetical protein